MEETAKKVLFVNSEIFPYLPETDIARIGRYLPQGIQERKKEIRSFMPRYGCINERKNQLHEVIRLSGMNIIIGDVDRPLVIKVASTAFGLTSPAWNTAAYAAPAAAAAAGLIYYFCKTKKVKEANAKAE